MGATERVEKLMALTLSDFHRSLNALAPNLPLEQGQTEVSLQVDKEEVRIVYDPLETVTLGGLLALPRARVKLHLGELDKAQRKAFLTRFDKAFQRGGG